MKLRVLLILLATVIYCPSFAQHPNAPRDYIPNHMLWLNTQLNGKIKGKFNYGLDVEMRRQADPKFAPEANSKVGNGQYNIFKNPYQDAIRPWVHYQPVQAFRFSIAPITWFGSWTYPVNGKTMYQPELRTSIQVTMYQSHRRVQLVQRYRYEFRFFGLKTLDEKVEDPTGPGESYEFLKSNRQGRFRYQLRMILPFNKPKVEKGAYYMTAFDEIFLNVGKNVPSYRFLDQNRCTLVFGYKFHTAMRVEMGYMNMMAFRMNNKAKNNVDLNNIFLVNFVFDDFNSLFKKKKKE